MSYKPDFSVVSVEVVVAIISIILTRQYDLRNIEYEKELEETLV